MTGVGEHGFVGLRERGGVNICAKRFNEQRKPAHADLVHADGAFFQKLPLPQIDMVIEREGIFLRRNATGASALPSTSASVA